MNGSDTRTMASIAATGFGLSALCIGDARGYAKPPDIADRVRNTLRFLWNTMPNVHGFFYHFVDRNTGARWTDVELSSFDTSLLQCGVLTARTYFADAEIQDLATKIYNRVDWPWMLNGGPTFSMGWKPESGSLSARWEHYCELMMIYLLGIGSATNPVSPDTWNAFIRPTVSFQGLTYIFRTRSDIYAPVFACLVRLSR